jgi:large subunit ribosomal protein L22
MKAIARAKYVRQSPYKVRRVLDLVRGMPVDDARATLDFTNRRAASTILKVLDSAVANPEHNFALDAEELYIAEAYADEGPTLKRWHPRARGRATRINKRTSHITIVVADEEEFEETEV